MISLPKVGTVPVGPQIRALVSHDWEVVKDWHTDVTTRLQTEHTEPRGQTTGSPVETYPQARRVALQQWLACAVWGSSSIG